jgi:hypothetical protein
MAMRLAFGVWQAKGTKVQEHTPSFQPSRCHQTEIEKSQPMKNEIRRVKKCTEKNQGNRVSSVQKTKIRNKKEACAWFK